MPTPRNNNTVSASVVERELHALLYGAVLDPPVMRKRIMAILKATHPDINPNEALCAPLFDKAIGLYKLLQEPERAACTRVLVPLSRYRFGRFVTRAAKALGHPIIRQSSSSLQASLVLRLLADDIRRVDCVGAFNVFAPPLDKKNNKPCLVVTIHKAAMNPQEKTKPILKIWGEVDSKKNKLVRFYGIESMWGFFKGESVMLGTLTDQNTFAQLLHNLSYSTSMELYAGADKCACARRVPLAEITLALGCARPPPYPKPASNEVIF